MTAQFTTEQIERIDRYMDEYTENRRDEVEDVECNELGMVYQTLQGMVVTVGFDGTVTEMDSSDSDENVFTVGQIIGF